MNTRLSQQPAEKVSPGNRQVRKLLIGLYETIEKSTQTLAEARAQGAADDERYARYELKRGNHESD